MLLFIVSLSITMFFDLPVLVLHLSEPISVFFLDLFFRLWSTLNISIRGLRNKFAFDRCIIKQQRRPSFVLKAALP